MQVWHHAACAPEQKEKLRIDGTCAQPEMHHAIGKAARSGTPLPYETGIVMRGIYSPELHQSCAGFSSAFSEAQPGEAARNEIFDKWQAEGSGRHSDYAIARQCLTLLGTVAKQITEYFVIVLAHCRTGPFRAAGCGTEERHHGRDLQRFAVDLHFLE